MAVKIINYVNNYHEMDMDSILHLCLDANKPGVRVDLVRGETIMGYLSKVDQNDYYDVEFDIVDGVVVVWEGYLTHPQDLVIALIDMYRK